LQVIFCPFEDAEPEQKPPRTMPTGANAARPVEKPNPGLTPAMIIFKWLLGKKFYDAKAAIDE